MKQKIEWYKEVLEIEPNSKVFFPLARILVADKQADEAIAVLTLGLSRHPYFIEARLLLVELLFAGGRHERLWHEVDMVSAMLGGYPGFWKAWAERLALEEGSRDTALAVSFVAASLQKLPISWTEVIEHGLRACFAKNGLSSPLPESSGQPGQSGRSGKTQISSGPEADYFKGAHPGMPHPAASAAPCESGREPGPVNSLRVEVEDFTDIEGELASEAPEESSADLGGDLANDLSGDFLEQADEASDSLAETADLLDDGETDLVADTVASPGNEGSAGMGLSSLPMTDLPDDDVLGEEALGDSESIPSVGLDSMPVESLSEKSVQDEAVPGKPAPGEGHPDDDDPENEEVYSLRTRSMAGILAEQGDYLGAREIYLELMSLAADEAELLELKEYAEEMQKKHSNQGQNQPSKPAEDAALSQSVRMNEQVMNKLKNLVDRLESRSQS